MFGTDAVVSAVNIRFTKEHSHCVFEGVIQYVDIGGEWPLIAIPDRAGAYAEDFCRALLNGAELAVKKSGDVNLAFPSITDARDRFAKHPGPQGHPEVFGSAYIDTSNAEGGIPGIPNNTQSCIPGIAEDIMMHLDIDEESGDEYR